MKIVYRKSFVKRYYLLSNKQQTLVDNALILFKINPQEKILRNHKLVGRLEGYRAISAGNDLRIILKEEGDYLIVFLINVGTHNQVY